jgi:hypothetical protein
MKQERLNTPAPLPAQAQRQAPSAAPKARSNKEID